MLIHVPTRDIAVYVYMVSVYMVYVHVFPGWGASELETLADQAIIMYTRS